MIANLTGFAVLGFIVGVAFSGVAVALFGARLKGYWRRDVESEVYGSIAAVMPRRPARALAHVSSTPRPRTLADAWPVNGVDKTGDPSWRARNLIEPLAYPYSDDTMDITRVVPPVNVAAEQASEQLNARPSVLLPTARLAGRLAAAVQRWVQVRRAWWRTATAQWQDTAPGQHRNDRERAAGGVR
jgi:hypothetical protein